MILFACEDGEGAIERLEEYHSHQLMREGEGGDREADVALALHPVG